MTNKGANKGRPDRDRTEQTRQRNTKDEKVARDPDVRGVTRSAARRERGDAR